jgi:hypothetical protein
MAWFEIVFIAQLSIKRTTRKKNCIDDFSFCDFFAGAEIKSLVLCSSSCWQEGHASA